MYYQRTAFMRGGRGTSADYVHGRDIPITRANIDDVQAARLLNGEQPLTPEGVVKEFIHFPEKRHLDRAYQLM